MKAFVQLLPAQSTKVNTIRIFEDGNFVFAHTEHNGFGPKIGFDVFRFEDGKIVENWDNLQETAPTANLSGHSMIDGPIAAVDLSNTESNKSLVVNFVDDVLVNGRIEKLT